MPASTMMKSAAPAITVAAAVLGATWWAGQTTSTLHVDTAVVTAGPIARSVIATGTLAPRLAAPDLTRMQLQVGVDESDIGTLTPLGAAVFTLDSFPGQVFHGVLSGVRMLPDAGDEATLAVTPANASAAADDATSTREFSYTAVIDVDNSDQRLLPGMTATVTLPGPNRTSAVRIPNAALDFRPLSGMPIADDKSRGEPDAATATTRDGEVRRVWLFDGQAFRPVTVEVGVSDGEWSELVKGALQAGDQLVTGADMVRHRHL